MLLVACSPGPEAEPEETTQETPTARVSGEEAYLQYCAGCHETGMLGAPVVGDSSAWDDRSQLWQAVAMEHAKTGYMDMPAKGSRPDLSDSTIDAAVEYMLEITFADMPPD
jgi:cytochrome c5